MEFKAKVRNNSNSSKSFLIVHLKMESGDRILQSAVKKGKKGISCNGQLGNISQNVKVKRVYLATDNLVILSKMLR